MSRILLQTTIAEHPDDWDDRRFSLLADELRAAGHDVTARNRANRGDDDPVLSRLDELDYDQLWLMAVDVGDGLTAAEARRHHAVPRERRRGADRSRPPGPGQLPAAGSDRSARSTTSTTRTPTRARCATTRTPRPSRGPTTTPAPTATTSRCSPTNRCTSCCAPRATASGRIEWFPAHPHEGAVSASVPFATVLAQGRSTATGRTSTSRWCWTASAHRTAGPWAGRVAESTFHHFADYNWDLDRGAPSFVTEPPGHADQGRPVAAGDLQGLRPQHRQLVASRDEPPCTDLDHRDGNRVTPPRR